MSCTCVCRAGWESEALVLPHNLKLLRVVSTGGHAGKHQISSKTGIRDPRRGREGGDKRNKALEKSNWEKNGEIKEIRKVKRKIRLASSEPGLQTPPSKHRHDTDPEGGNCLRGRV